jgi:class 3 adenylate cyclase
MESVRRKSLRTPDESVDLPGVVEDIVEIGGYTVARSIQQPGWRWSLDTRAAIQGTWCEAHHVGVVLSGRWGAELRDGTVLEWGPDDVFDCPPGHDGYTVGDEPCVMIEWAGVRTFVASHTGFGDRVLATLLFTDVVGSTDAVVRMGDVAWHDRLSSHYHTATAQIERFGGRRIDTTGDGLLATFTAPARALRCGAAIRRAARDQDLQIRVGVHVGEVGFAGGAIQGVAVHEAARVMGAAGAGEILATEITRSLAGPAGLRFDDRGRYAMKGLPEQHLFAYLDDLQDQLPGPSVRGP